MFPQLAVTKVVKSSTTLTTTAKEIEGVKGCVAAWWLPIGLTNGNTGRGWHWGSKHKERKAMESFLREYFGGQRVPFGFPVSLVVTRVLGKNQRLWDSDSVLRGNWKELQDSLVAVGFFHDDSPKWISNVIGRQDATMRESGPAINITVIRSGM